MSEWKSLLVKGKWYTAKQVSLLALIKEVTARRWLQQGVGQGYLEIRMSGIVKRFRVKDELRNE